MKKLFSFMNFFGVLPTVAAFFFVFTNSLQAENYSLRLKTLTPGMDSAQVLDVMGQPTEKVLVARWIYPGENEVVVKGEEIADIRLSPALLDKKISLRPHQRDVRPENPVAYMRIGMGVAEALEVAGQPERIETGQDWYYSSRHRVEISGSHVRKIDMHIKASLETLDWIRLNFSAGGLLFMNITLALIMFGVALGIKISHFRLVVKKPKSVLLGVISQFVALPALTFLLVLLIRPTPSVAMGMILVAACPGGNISNFISSLAKGNVALSISLTAIATISAIFMTPFNFTLWGSLYSEAANLVIPIRIDPLEMLKTVIILLGIPVIIGIWFSDRFPVTTLKIIKPVKNVSIILFLGFIVAAFSANVGYFLKYIHLIILIVFVHNALALLTGYSISTVFKLPPKDRRTLSIETGIQNSGLALVLIFNPKLFDGLGGMAFIAAWWGLWHILSGLAIAWFWSRKPLPVEDGNN
ncbi:MAG: bile acid:sodium symporter family protein [Bacteroidales bacterium]|nr:bile acid:sodium symporter family protein [Bacteroidales bacterium]MDZ4203284.1 bile acid:sodium symporter family protein [Bacteroidales bacterium]